MEGKKYYAHSLPQTSEDKWQLLEDHLRQTADLAAGFAKSFSAEDWGTLSGSVA
jgi:hypothetical protein